MENTRVKISSIVESQLPLFVREDYPLVTELLTEYYKSLESKGSSYDIVQNIDNYVKINNISNLVESCELTSNVSFSDTIINVNNTDGFPKSYGLLLVNDEIILYPLFSVVLFLAEIASAPLALLIFIRCTAFCKCTNLLKPF